MEHLSTPKQFNDSLQVTKASMWVALTAVLILLAGLLVWAIFGYLEVTIQAYGVADDGVITSYIAGDSAVTIGMEARIGEAHNPQNLDEQAIGVITAVDLVATNVGETTDDPSVSVNSLRPADHSFMVTISA
ncbi:MAG: hypothetical protein FWD41_02790, partial [Actinomycetia bacterium]|nr:hypothetical protein [Actinomycetes bacterium]